MQHRCGKSRRHDRHGRSRKQFAICSASFDHLITLPFGPFRPAVRYPETSVCNLLLFAVSQYCTTCGLAQYFAGIFHNIQPNIPRPSIFLSHPYFAAIHISRPLSTISPCTGHLSTTCGETSKSGPLSAISSCTGHLSPCTSHLSTTRGPVTSTSGPLINFVAP